MAIFDNFWLLSKIFIWSLSKRHKRKKVQKKPVDPLPKQEDDAFLNAITNYRNLDDKGRRKSLYDAIEGT